MEWGRILWGIKSETNVFLASINEKFDFGFGITRFFQFRFHAQDCENELV